MRRLILLILFTIPLITIDGQEFDTIVDTRDAEQYRIVRIGSQWWMAENLRATKYSDNLAIPLVEEETAWDALDFNDKAYCFVKPLFMAVQEVPWDKGKKMIHQGTKLKLKMNSNCQCRKIVI